MSPALLRIATRIRNKETRKKEHEDTPHLDHHSGVEMAGRTLRVHPHSWARGGWDGLKMGTVDSAERGMAA